MFFFLGFFFRLARGWALDLRICPPYRTTMPVGTEGAAWFTAEVEKGAADADAMGSAVRIGRLLDGRRRHLQQPELAIVSRNTANCSRFAPDKVLSHTWRPIGGSLDMQLAILSRRVAASRD